MKQVRSLYSSRVARRGGKTHPVVPSLVFVIDPVERLHAAVLDAVFGDPLVGVAATLREDPRHHAHLLQVDLQPLVLVVKLGEPRAPKRRTDKGVCWCHEKM